MPAKRYTFDDFNPNDLEKGRPEWATFVPNRRTQFKLHNSRGVALNACNFGQIFILYQWINHGWVEIEQNRKFRADKCDMCTVPQARAKYVIRSQWIFKKTKRPKFRFLCFNCRGVMRNS